MGRVIDLAETARVRAEAKFAGRRVVFTNGYFDLLHVGHVRYLQAARALGDLLIVGVNNDATARRFKGPGRPIISEDGRAEMVAALACVGWVVLFEEDTAQRLVSILKPDVYAKGGDYDRATLPEAPIVEAYGGQVVLLPYQTGHSTTAIVETILERYRR